MTGPELDSLLADLPRPLFDRGDDIASRIFEHARRQPDAPAIISGDETYTWREFSGKVAAAAGALAEHSVGKGDRVALLSRNSTQYAEFFFGALAAGASVVPLPTMSTPDALSLMLRDSKPCAIAVSRPYVDAAAAILTEETGVRVRYGLDFADNDWLSWRDDGREFEPAISIDGDDEFDVMYSSGTTGVPKGIVHSHAVRKASYAGGRAKYFPASTVNIVSTPFYSNTTCVTWLLTTAVGGVNVLMQKFDPGVFLDLVAKHRVSHAMLVPVQYDRILAHPGFTGADLSSLKYVFSTSAPLRAQTKRAILDRFSAELIEIYGMTEGGVVTSLSARTHPDKLASVGTPGETCEIRIIDETGREIAQGLAGEVVGRAPNTMCGYLNLPEETANAFWRDAEGRVFLRSGDIGRIDEDGFLYLLDRKKDVIISGGFNIYASDLEAVLQTHPAVEQVAIIGIPSEAWGETPLACVVRKPGASVTSEELVSFCNSRVGKNQRLSGVEFRDVLPRSAIGKVLKSELKEPYWAPPTAGGS